MAAASSRPGAAPSLTRSRQAVAVFSAACLILVALVAAVTLPQFAGVRAATTAATSPDGPTIPLYGQQWQPWGPQDLGTSSSTIASEGCALTASTMLLEDYGVSTSPGALNQWLISNGGYLDQDLLVWGAVAQYAKSKGVSISYSGWAATNLATIDSSLQAGNPVIAQVSLDGNMHFVLITGMGPDGTLWINDPWFGDHTTFQSRYGNPATGIQSVRLFTGTPVASPSLSTMTAGGSETVSASGGLGTFVSGNQVLDLPYTTATSDWLQGTPMTVGSWSNQQITFTAPTSLSAGFVVVETAYGDPNFWFPYTVSSDPTVSVASLGPTVGAGSGGTSVTVTGSGFYLPAQVTFGGAAATSVVEISSTELQVVTPAGTGSDPVQVSDWLGTSPTSSGGIFTYQAALPPGSLVALAPTRICDTRPDNPSGLTGSAAQCDGKTLVAGVPLTVQVSGLAGIPAEGATAVSLNVTVAQPTGSGFLTVYPGGQTIPRTSNLNFGSGQTVADLVDVGLSPKGQVEVVTSAPSADVVIDVEGYFAASTTGSGLYSPVTPTRICDTRPDQPANQCTGKTLGPGGTLTLQVAGLAGVPSSAEAVSLDVAATDTTAASYLTVYPSGEAPTSSNLNWTQGATVANQVVAALNSSGAITVYNLSGSTDVVVDLFGFFSGSGGTGAQLSAAYTPTRICDTRTDQPANQCTGKTLGPGTSLEVKVAGLAGVPTDAKAVVVTVTVTNTTAASYLAVFPSGAVPLISNLNWPAGATVPNLVTATLNSSGGITVYNYSGSADVIVDVMGWYG